MKDQKLYDRLVARTEIDAATGCWNWTGPRRKTGHPGNRYGYIGIWNLEKHRSRTVHSHRAMMIALHGPLTPQQCACHRCDNVLCINPNHLFIGSMKENIWDSRRKLRHYESRRDYCERGHPLFGDNVEMRKQSAGKSGLKRVCKTCQKARYRLRKGWPEHLAFDMSIKVPMGYMIDRSTGEFISTAGLRVPPSATGEQ